VKATCSANEHVYDWNPSDGWTQTAGDGTVTQIGVVAVSLREALRCLLKRQLPNLRTIDCADGRECIKRLAEVDDNRNFSLVRTILELLATHNGASKYDHDLLRYVQTTFRDVFNATFVAILQSRNITFNVHFALRRLVDSGVDIDPIYSVDLDPIYSVSTIAKGVRKFLIGYIDITDLYIGTPVGQQRLENHRPRGSEGGI
jgi:hypothetical protein